MATNLSPGFRFHPTDEELVGFYLKRRVIGKPFRGDPIGIVDVYKYEPWDLPCLSKMKTRDLEWYFYTGLDKKYGKGSSRTNRATEKGYWKTTGKDRPVNHANRTVGMKKTLVYHFGRAPTGSRTNWVMHEYRSVDDALAQSGVAQDAFVLCRIFEKSGAGPKNGEKYGAPLIEEEWDNFDLISPLESAGDDYINEVADVDGLLESKDLDQKPVASFAPFAVVDDKLMNAVLEEGDFMETNDLNKMLDMAPDAIESADFPSNFHYGECSSHPEHSQAFISDRKLLADNAVNDGGDTGEQSYAHPEHSQAFISDQKLLVDTMGNSEPQNGQPFNMAQQYGADNNAANDGGDTGEQRYAHPEHSQAFISDRKLLADTMGNSGTQNDQPFSMAQQYGADINATNGGGDTGGQSYDDNSLNFDCAFDNLAQCLNGDWSPLNLDGILETDDLANMAEGNPVEADPSVIGMVDEYLSYHEDDIYKCISFDSPGNEGSESAIPDQGPPAIQQSVEVETRDIKPVSEAQSSNEASLKHVPHASKLVSEDTNPIVKHAHKFLASMPAPPAFASEFPTKGFALGLHAGAQASSSTHITAGMISITDITLRGNAMDWMVGKNGGFNAALMSSGFSETNYDPDSLMPISGLVSSKTTFVLSHGCLYLMGFSVLILSLSYKIGSFMYTGK